MGWRPWARHSNTAQITLPQQVGVDFIVRERKTGLEYADGGCTRPQEEHVSASAISLGGALVVRSWPPAL